MMHIFGSFECAGYHYARPSHISYYYISFFTSFFSLIRPAHALILETPPVLGRHASHAAPVTVTMATHTARVRRSSLATDAIHADAMKMELSRVPRWPAPRKKGPKLRIWTLCLRPIPASSMALRLRLARPMWLPMDATPGEFVTNTFTSAVLLARASLEFDLHLLTHFSAYMLYFIAGILQHLLRWGCT